MPCTSLNFCYVNYPDFFTFLLGTGHYLTRYLCVAQIMIVVFQRNRNHDHVIRGIFQYFGLGVLQLWLYLGKSNIWHVTDKPGALFRWFTACEDAVLIMCLWTKKLGITMANTTL
jgi:hypothetical protein